MSVIFDGCLFVCQILIFPNIFVHVYIYIYTKLSPRTCPLNRVGFSLATWPPPFKLLQQSCLNFRGIAIYNNDGQVDSWRFLMGSKSAV